MIPIKREVLNFELMKLIPENYKILILPAFFNFTDPERIRTVIAESAAEFLLVNLFYKLIHIENSKKSHVCYWG